MIVSIHSLASTCAIVALRYAHDGADTPIAVASCSTLNYGRDLIDFIQNRMGIVDPEYALRTELLTVVESSEAGETVTHYEQALGVGAAFRSDTTPPNPVRPRRGAPTRPVRDTETGITYPSASAAALAVNVSPSAMSHHLKGRLASAGGRQFEYAI